MMGWKRALGGASSKSFGGPTGMWDGFKTDTDERVAGGMAAGLAVDTMVSTSKGWRPVQTLREGDLVMTFDDGMQPITRVTRGFLWNAPTYCPEALWPLYVPADALGNKSPLLLMAEQTVMVESDRAEDLYGDPFVLVPAPALAGVLGIERVPPEGSQHVVSIAFEKDQIVFANGSALLFCPAHSEDETVALEELLGNEDAADYNVLSRPEAMELAKDLEQMRFGAAVDATPPANIYAA